MHHFFGTNEKLFVAAMRFPMAPSEMLEDVAAMSRRRLGEAIVRTLLHIWGDAETRGPAIGLLRSPASLRPTKQRARRSSRAR